MKLTYAAHPLFRTAHPVPNDPELYETAPKTGKRYLTLAGDRYYNSHRTYFDEADRPGPPIVYEIEPDA